MQIIVHSKIDENVFYCIQNAHKSVILSSAINLFSLFIPSSSNLFPFSCFPSQLFLSCLSFLCPVWQMCMWMYTCAHSPRGLLFLLSIWQGVGTGLSERGPLSLEAEDCVKSDCSGRLGKTRTVWGYGEF